jgi:hypothetical protein
MDEDEDRKAKIVKLVQEAANDAGHKPRRRTPPPPVKAAGNVIYVNARGDAQVAGRDININTKQTTRTIVTAPPGSLTPAQAKRVLDAIEKVVNIEATGSIYDGDPRRRLFSKWHKRVKDHFDVPSYLFIPAARAQDVLAWLRQEAAIKRPKLRRTDPAAWRTEHYRAIWARSSEIGMSKADVYALVLQRLDKRVTSLKQLGQQALRRLYQILMAKR